MIEIYSLNHESANSDVPSIALSNIIKANKRITKYIYPINDSDKGKISKGNKIHARIEVNDMGVDLLCELLAVFPDSLIENPVRREKRFQQKKQKGLVCKGSKHRKGCCQVCKHSCPKCYRPNCKEKKCCLTGKKCNHKCVCCDSDVTSCSNSSLVCCEQCNKCLNCQDVPSENSQLCENLKVRRSAEKLKNYQTTTVQWMKGKFPIIMI